MAAWCLPRDLTDKFLEAMRSGEIVPGKLAAMSSAERRAEFAKLLGDENAREVNAQFEAKLLLKDQKAGLVTWARKLGGLTEPARRDILATINKLDRVLNPEEEQSFLEDLAAKKLGVAVTEQEAKQIFDLAQKAEQLRAEIVASGNGDYRAGWNLGNTTAYARAQQALLTKLTELKSPPASIKRLALGLYNVPRELMVGLFHSSAPFVQLVGHIGTKQWTRSFGQMWQYMMSEEKYNDLYANMMVHPDFELLRKAKLGLTNLNDKFTTAEEGIQAHLLSDLYQAGITERTGFGNPFRASQRGFVGTINYVRFYRAVDLVNAARAMGVEVTPEVAGNIASMVNVFSGRGPIKEGWAGALNGIFFAPRKISAMVNAFNPFYFAKLDPFTRQAAVKQLVGAVASVAAVYTLAKLAGAKESLDPNDPDFLKIDIAGEKLDLTGGNSTYFRLIARLAIAGIDAARGEPIPSIDSPGRNILRFWANKLAPVTGIMAWALYGQDLGRPAFTVPNVLAENFTPLPVHAIMDFWINNPDERLNPFVFLPVLTSFLGVSVESPLPPISRSGLDVWGDPLGAGATFEKDPVNVEAKRLGIKLDFPPQKIRGVKLSDVQYEQYVHRSGVLAHQRISELMGNSGFQTETPQEQKKDFSRERAEARSDTREELFPQLEDAEQ